MKENLRFKQLRLNYINNQKKESTGDSNKYYKCRKYYKIYGYFSFIFSTVPKKVELLKISKVM